MVRMSILRKSRKALPPLWSKRIELKVPLCCEDCEENVRGQLIVLEGVKEINIDLNSQKVVVFSHCDVKLEPSIVLDAVKRVKNRAELWKPSKTI